MSGLAGFWIRVCAVVIDLIAVTVVVILAANVAASFECYIPPEEAVLFVYCFYMMALVFLTSQTLGKWLCGIKVTRRKGGRARLPAALIRASFHTLFLLLLGVPFLVVAAGRDKRGWHDRLSGTQVEYVPGQARRRRSVVAALSVCVGVWVAVPVWSAARLYPIHRAFHHDAEVAAAEGAPGADRPDANAVDANSVGEVATWLEASSRPPREYLVDFAARHQVTIVGELHGKKQFLEFFSDAIADLYHQAGVRAIALECCRSSQDASLARLLTADRYDSDLALEIARQAPWRAWGYREHWAVLERVWRLNRSLPEDAEPLRVVGICPPIDLISLGMFKEGNRLRLLRVLDDFPVLMMADAFYARRVERQAFEAGKRTLVWVGAAHSGHCQRAQRKARGGVKRYFGMGAMLRGRYGPQVGTVLLHNDSSFPEIAALVERCLTELGRDRLGFDIAASPLASVNVKASPSSAMPVTLPLRAHASGYVVVAPLGHIESAQWWDGFITPRMFGLYRPYYENLCNRVLNDHEDANLHMREGVHRL